MKIRLLTSRCGIAGAQNAGDEIEVGSAEAARMIKAGQAVPVREVRDVETTAKKRTTRKRSTKKGG